MADENIAVLLVLKYTSKIVFRAQNAEEKSITSKRLIKKHKEDWNCYLHILSANNIASLCLINRILM